MSQVLVAYFSATGTTARVARAVVDACGGDLFEIAPQTPYTSADLIWTNPKSLLPLPAAVLPERLCNN